MRLSQTQRRGGPCRGGFGGETRSTAEGILAEAPTPP
jgi:hypothetical protein